MKNREFAELVSRVRSYYDSAVLVAMPRTDGGFGVFSPNDNLNKPPYCVGVGHSERDAWIHCWKRIAALPVPIEDHHD